MFNHKKVSAIIPALNEAKSIKLVVSELLQLQHQNQTLIDEVIVCDNGSTDGTAELARRAGARVVNEPTPGYGRACLKAIGALGDADIVLFIDGDRAFYTSQALELIKEASNTGGLAIGSRTLGSIAKGALTPPQRFGNTLASFLVQWIWHYPVTDLGPFRAINKKALAQLKMKDQTFGWTIEMQIKAITHRIPMTEVPVDTRMRIGISKISGTVKGTIGAGIGILSMITKLWWQEYTLKRGLSNELEYPSNKHS